MGMFLDSFGLSSGMTLGSLAAQSAFEFGGQALARSFNQATAKHCAERYDPVVRDDLAHLMVLGRLEPADYPFEDKTLKLGLKKWQWILLLVVVLFVIWNLRYEVLFSIMTRQVSSGLSDSLSFIAFVAVVVVGRMFVKKRKAEKQMNDPTGVDTEGLKKCGQQYWHVREYVRQALELGRFTPQEGLRKLCNTALVGRFPDSTDEIEANAFFLKQKLNQ